MSSRILIVDDEEVVLRSCLRILGEAGHEVDTVQDSEEALKKIDEGDYEVVVLDIMMPKKSGLEILQSIKEEHPDVDVIMVTGLSQIETAVLSMKLGAFDYLSKPFEPDELVMVVNRALERKRLLRENLRLRSELSSKYRFENIIGSSPKMQSVYRLVAKCAPTNSTVLLKGESGTGKELIARPIHYQTACEGTNPLSPWTAALSARAFSRVSSSGTSRVPLPVPLQPKRASSRSPREERSSLTKSATYRFPPRPACCGSSRSGSIRLSAELKS